MLFRMGSTAALCVCVCVCVWKWEVEFEGIFKDLS